MMGLFRRNQTPKKTAKAMVDALMDSGIATVIPANSYQKVTPELIKEVQTLHSQGLAQAVIGKAVGRSRGSVAGILFRLRQSALGIQPPGEDKDPWVVFQLRQSDHIVLKRLLRKMQVMK
ncbi:hypothetical protein LCGC14_2839360 [marine sediment metagenome]|uniref:Uncharacterized protein n=1 Tax=marine sediment metagenome TaxID=412755 RepID=A0A0F9AK57_9ZZZZ